MTRDQVAAATRVLRRSCPSPTARGALADLLETVVTVRALGSPVPPMVEASFAAAVLSLTTAPAESPVPPVTGAGGTG